jgi:hypothetical protein
MKRRSLNPRWLRFTEETNALDFLEKATKFIGDVERDRRAWKWVVLCLHGALYGFAVCACKGTDYQNVVVRNRKGEERLISFDSALERCENLVNGHPLVLSTPQRNSLRRLKQDLRNNFEHYVPRGWSIEIHGMPQIAFDVLEVIRFLAIETGTCFHLNQSQIKKVKSWVYQGKRFLRSSALWKEGEYLQRRSKLV